MKLTRQREVESRSYKLPRRTRLGLALNPQDPLGRQPLAFDCRFVTPSWNPLRHNAVSRALLGGYRVCRPDAAGSRRGRSTGPAGTGSLAVWAKVADASEVIVNELSERRAGLFEDLDFDRVNHEDAAQLNNILPKDVRPTSWS